MAKHNVSFEVPRRALGKADVVFRIREDADLLGTLEVSNGAIVWFPRKGKYGRKISWKRFSELMEENATRFEKR